MSPRKKKKTSPNPVLAAACEKNLPIDLRIAGEKSPDVYRSRFLALEERPDSIALLVEAPAPKGTVVPIRPGQQARVTFTLNDQENYFEAVVRDRGRHQLNRETSIATLELEMPEEVFSAGKRGFYRHPIDSAEIIEVRLAILASDGGDSKRIRWREKAALTDIGGGGLGFRISEGRSLLLSPGTRLLLTFKLGPEEEEIILLGRICFSLRQPKLRQAFFGVQFIEVESEIEYKQNVDKVLHYVAYMQRRSLGERTG
jgi:c-di-GMP-binding flagellar brake protein YcgR